MLPSKINRHNEIAFNVGGLLASMTQRAIHDGLPQAEDADHWVDAGRSTLLVLLFGG